MMRLKIIKIKYRTCRKKYIIINTDLITIDRARKTSRLILQKLIRTIEAVKITSFWKQENNSTNKIGWVTAIGVIE